MNEHGIIMPYRTFSLHLAQVHSFSSAQYKWKKYLEISTIFYIPLLILYYFFLLTFFLPYSPADLHFVLVSISGIISVLCIIMTLDSLQKEDPETFTELIEYWIGLTILMIFLVVYFAKVNIELKADRHAYENFVTEKSNYNFEYEKGMSVVYNEFTGSVNLRSNKSDKNNDNTDKDDSKYDKDDSQYDKDDSQYDKDDSQYDRDDIDKDDKTIDSDDYSSQSEEPSETSSNTKNRVKKVIFNYTCLGFTTLVIQCTMIFLINKVRRTLTDFRNLQEQPIELQPMNSK